MTEKRARALHRAMWRWLAKHPGNGKFSWPGWKKAERDKDVLAAYDAAMCFACLGRKQCKMCPIMEKAGRCSYRGSLWDKYLGRLLQKYPDPAEWADVCNRMADAWREIPEGR